MVGWRELNLYNNEKRADLYASGARVRVTKVTNISPADIFYRKLKANKKFKRLKGFTTWNMSMDYEGGYYKKYYRYPARQEQSEWYVYKGDGKRMALINMPEYSDLDCRVVVHVLWVPRHLGRQGIGTEVMRELMLMTDIVNNLCKSGDKYDEKHVTCGSFTLTLCPNSFVIRENHWDIEKIAAGTDGIDWTARPGSEADNAPDRHMMDETDAYLPKDERRATLKELRAFYCDKLGFIECSELAFWESFNWETGRMNRQMIITGRSAAHQRWPLLYPAENLDVWERKEDE